MLRMHGLSGLRRLSWRSPLTGSRRANSSSGNGHHKSNPYASWPPPVQRAGKVALMTPGIRMTLTILAISFGLIKLELYIQETTGKGLLHGWFRELIIMDEEQDQFLAQVEQTRQMTKAHYNLSQRPIYRTNYPEGANLANPYGLTSADKSVKTKEAKTNFE